MQHLVSHKKMGFETTSLHSRKEPHPLHYLAQRTSFWIAALSLVAFVSGNMMGKHGWQVFWRSVVGGVDDNLIVYTGTVTPIAEVPDYEKWARYGGNPHEHTFRQVPKDALRPLPHYNPATEQLAYDHAPSGDIFSIGHMGSYDTGAEGSGSHPGVDIRTPVGTPIRSIANGIVHQIKTGGGFGNAVVIRHPNVPDPHRTSEAITLYSNYAHLSSMLVEVGDIVQKGQQIAYSGDTGFVTGPHLHFQIDREEAPWHPYWPFSDSEARKEGLDFVGAVNTGLFKARGMMYTIHPMLYVQANHPPTTLIAREEGGVEARDPTPTRVVKTVEQRRQERIAAMRSQQSERLAMRISRRQSVERIIGTTQSEPVEVVSRETVVSRAVEELPATASEQTVKRIGIEHDGSFNRGWETITITLLNEDGTHIQNPLLSQDLYLRTAYGSAEFRPSVLTLSDFTNGQATVRILPRGRRTIVIQAHPFSDISRAMRYER